MPQKLTKTRAELEILLMAELRKDPVCCSVDAIAITSRVGRDSGKVAVERELVTYSPRLPVQDLGNH